MSTVSQPAAKRARTESAGNGGAGDRKDNPGSTVNLPGHAASANSTAASTAAEASVDSGIFRDTPSLLLGHENVVNALAWTQDGGRLCSGSMDRTLKLWDPGHGQRGKAMCVRTLRHAAAIDSVCTSPVNPQLVATCADLKLHIWDARVRANDSAKQSFAVSTPGADILNCDWHPGNNYIVTANKDDVLAVSDIRKGGVVKKTKFKYEVNEILFAEGGQRLLVAGCENLTSQGTLGVLDFKAGCTFETLAVLKAHTRTHVYAVTPHSTHE